MGLGERDGQQAARATWDAATAAGVLHTVGDSLATLDEDL